MIKKLALLTAVLLVSTVASADRPGLNLTEEQMCYGVTGYNALIATIETEHGHNSAATICYIDSDESGNFTPQGDTPVYLNNSNTIVGCAACPASPAP